MKSFEVSQGVWGGQERTTKKRGWNSTNGFQTAFWGVAINDHKSQMLK